MHVAISAFFEEKAAVDKVPATVSHCMLAVNKKGHRARDAWNICRASLKRSKHLKSGSRRDANVSDVRQTQKGTRRSMKHGTEKGSHEKYTRFKKLFRKIEPFVTRK